MDFSIAHIDELASTNDAIKGAIEDGSPEGTCIQADMQKAGYGRYGRHWESPLGGLYMSVLLRPYDHVPSGGGRDEMDKKIPTLSLIAGLAVKRALSRYLAPDCQIKIKWPNDLVVENAEDSPARTFNKICGISMELYQGAICAGIGVNVFSQGIRDGRGSEDARNKPVYLESVADPGLDISIRKISEEIALQLEILYEKWLAEPFSSFVPEYNESSFLGGKDVTIENMGNDIEYEGKVLGIDDLGQLVLEVTDGQVVSIASGEAHVHFI